MFESLLLDVLTDLPFEVLDDKVWPMTRARKKAEADAGCCGKEAGPDLAGFGIRVGLSLALAGQSMVFGLGYNNALSAGEAPAMGSAGYWLLHGALIASTLGVVALLGGPLLRQTFAALRGGRITVEALFVLSAAGAFAGSLISTLRGEGSVYYEVVAIVLSVYAIGKQISAVQRGKVGRAVAAFRKAFDEATVERQSGPERVPVEELTTRDRVLVRPGEAIPVDGRILEGTGYVRETALTGEPGPVRKESGGRLRAGTWSLDGNFRVLPETTTDRKIDRILAALETARQRPSRLQEEADRLMRFFVPVVTAVAAATFFGWLLAAASPWDALFNAMAVLLVACPCALGLALPTGVWAGLFYLSQRGLVGRNGHLLDVLAQAEVVVFDKTGTLSGFTMEADSSFLTPDGTDRENLVASMAAMARQSHHPVSTAIAARCKGGEIVEEGEVVPGRGLRGRVDGHALVFGEPELLRAEGIVPQTPAQKVTRDGTKWIQVGFDGSFAGSLGLREKLHAEAEGVVEGLRQLGCTVRILSGDPEPARAAIGGAAVEGSMSPEAKASAVEELNREGKRCLFIGDGINDLLAMEAAEAAIAVEAGTELTTAFADGILLNDRIAVLPHAVRRARHLRKGLQGNLRFALVYNLFGMALAAGGVLHPVVAALLMVASSVLVSARAMRAAGHAAV